jgi:hypothetical protein
MFLLVFSSVLRASAFTHKTRTLSFSGASHNFKRICGSGKQPASSAIPWPELPPIAPTAMPLFLVRHGEVINPGGDRPVVFGAMDVPVSPLGEGDARAAAQFLQQYNLQHIACSPLIWE